LEIREIRVKLITVNYGAGHVDVALDALVSTTGLTNFINCVSL